MADIAMTGEAGANRTFRSIFGDREQRHDEVLKIELEQSDSSASGAAGAAADDDDEAMWSDEPPLDGDADNNDLPGLQFAQRKSMEEWADDDDEEENWKDALQDRVNQLELAFQHNNDAAAAESRRRFEEQQQQLQLQQPALLRTDFSQSLPVSTRFTASGGSGGGAERPRQGTRHKMQRTSSSHACITGDNGSSNRQSHLWNFQRKVVAAPTTTTLDQDSRRRSTSIDFVARNIQSVEHHRKRSGSMSGISINKTDSPRHSLSRKDSLESNRSSLSRSNSSSFRGNKAAASAGGTSSGAAVFILSNTEAIRRFVLDDVKTMSMERLVGDAQRLHFLEDFYQSHQGPGPAPSATIVAPPSPSSSSPMSTS
ncbi:Pyruvate kinase [Phytophthora cinnamomi]|uniref:Pyruvate kinase n=1 Tax=Phytophthora cinnamomi TaxID=4785 RepID=UPI003559CBE8|nr:Pyruvate kinase [Phytophthora cinnamomi]